MSNVNITRSGPEVMADNPPAETRRANLDRATDYRPEPKQQRDWQTVGAHYIGAALLLVIGGIVYGAFRLALCWGAYSETCYNWRMIEAWLPVALLGALALAGMVKLAMWAEMSQAKVDQLRVENDRFSLLPDRFGNPTPARLYKDMRPDQMFESYFKLLTLATDLKRDTAPHELYPSSLNTLSISNAHTNNQELLGAPTGDEALTLIPDPEWRGWIDTTPHLLIAGRTGGGKTTLASAILADRILAGDEVLVLDPHWQPGKWFGIRAAAKMPDIMSMLEPLITELDNRYDEYHAGKPEEEFQRITVLIDEAPAIVDSCVEYSASGRQKLKDPRWKRFTKRLGSEARKVRISVILLTQSTLVEDLMINTRSRSNFIRIGLGDQARPLLSSEEAKRKQVLYGLLQGQRHPATIEHDGAYHVLDTSNVLDLAKRSVRQHVKVWDHTRVRQRPQNSTSYDNDELDDQHDNHDLNKRDHEDHDYHADRLSGLSGTLRITKPNRSAAMQTADRQTDRRQTEWESEKKLAVLRYLRNKGLTRNQARMRLEAIGQGFDNDDWTRAGQ